MAREVHTLGVHRESAAGVPRHGADGSSSQEPFLELFDPATM
jgi:hypothetical protein